MYSYGSNIYLVRGQCNSCFYDLNNKVLFHCSSDYADIAEYVIAFQNDELPKDDKEKFNVLQKEGILVKTDLCLCSGDIHDLKIKTSIDFAWIEITNQCNMRCIHCYDEACIGNQTHLSFVDFQRIIDELKAFGIKSIQLIGGEPLVLKDLKDMARYACKNMESVTIFTNASLITEELASFFAEYGMKIAISVYSYNETAHDYVTQIQGSYKRTMNGIKKLKDYGVKYRIATVLMDGVEIGESNTDLFTLKNGDVVRLTGRANGRLLNEELIKKKLITPLNFHHSIEKAECARMVSGHNCFSRRLYIAADMNVYPCVMERRICHGNLKNNSLKDIISSDILSFNKDKVDTCRICELRYACFDCRPNSITGSIYEKPWYCTYDPTSGKWERVEEAILRIKTDLGGKS